MPDFFVMMFWPYFVIAAMWGRPPRPKLRLVKTTRTDEWEE